MKILKIKPSDSDFHLFENFPKQLYNTEQLASKQSEGMNIAFLQNCYVAIEEGAVKARIALYDNPNLYYQNKKALCLGNYECVDDVNIALQLFNAVWKDMEQSNATYIIGPMNGSTWDTYRFSTQHNSPHIFLEPYHHLYYNDHFLAAGFTCIGKYFSSKDTTLKINKPEVLELMAIFEAQGVTFRNIGKAEFETELERLYDFNVVAFQKNFLYTPISKEAFIKKYLPIKSIFNPDFLKIAEDKDKNLICFFFCIPDFINTKEKSLILKTIARNSDKNWRGLGHVVGNLVYQSAIEQGYQSVVHAFMYDAGFSTTISKNFSGDRYKNYQLYGKEIK